MASSQGVLKFFGACRATWRNDKTFAFDSATDAQASAAMWAAAFDEIGAADDEIMGSIPRVAARVAGFPAPAHFVEEVRAMRDERRDAVERTRKLDNGTFDADPVKIARMIREHKLTTWCGGDEAKLIHLERIDESKRRSDEEAKRQREIKRLRALTDF